MKYHVTLTADAYVSTSVEVTADDPVNARVKAIRMAQDGDVLWQYNGVQEGTEETQDITAVAS